MALDLSVPYYALSLLRSGQDVLELLDPLVQVIVVAGVIALVTKGSPLALFVGLAVAAYSRLWYLDNIATQAGPRSSSIGDQGDVSRLSNETLTEELKSLNPDGRFRSLYGSPQLFHLIYQISFVRSLAKDIFDQILIAADHYIEGSLEIKRTDNLRDVGTLLSQSIERADTLVQACASLGLQIPLASDRELEFRFKDTLKSLRIVLRRDLTVLRQIAERHTNRTLASWEPLPDIDAPRAWDN